MYDTQSSSALLWPAFSCVLFWWLFSHSSPVLHAVCMCVFLVLFLLRLIWHVLSSCPASRTLQWDSDPSVLQLQADSELGYLILSVSVLLSVRPAVIHIFIHTCVCFPAFYFSFSEGINCESFNLNWAKLQFIDEDGSKMNCSAGWYFEVVTT